MVQQNEDVIKEAFGPGEGSLSAYANDFLTWAAREPYTFLSYVLLFLSPFFVISALLSWKLSKAIEKQEREMRRKKAIQAKAAEAKNNKESKNKRE